LPKSIQPVIASIFAKFLTVLGAREQLPGEGGFWSYALDKVSLRQGLGLPGFFIALPALIISSFMIIKYLFSAKKIKNINAFRLNIIFLWSMCGGIFITAHAILQWQTIGLTRLLLHYIILLCPLSLLFISKNKYTVTLSLIVMTLQITFFSLFYLAFSTKMSGFKVENAILKNLESFFPDRSRIVEYKVEGKKKYVIKEKQNLTNRTIYNEFLKKIKPGSTIGVIGNVNTEVFFLFGQDFSNRVIPLVDCRMPDRVLEIGKNIDFIVIDPKFEGNLKDQLKGKLELENVFFEAKSNDSILLSVFKITQDGGMSLK
jgi:hypothetical protein